MVVVCGVLPRMVSSARWAGAEAGRRTELSGAEPSVLTPVLSQSSPARESQPSGAEISASRCVRQALRLVSQEAESSGAGDWAGAANGSRNRANRAIDSARLAPSGWPAVGHRRLQPLSDRAVSHRQHVCRCGARATGTCLGLPEAMLMDHGVPWCSMQATGLSTSLSLWLIRQGIQLQTLSGAAAPLGIPRGSLGAQVDCQKKIDTAGRRWKISRALAGERAHLLPSQGRILVYYCNALMRELDPGKQRSTIVQRCFPETKHDRQCKESPETICKPSPRT